MGASWGPLGASWTRVGGLRGHLVRRCSEGPFEVPSLRRLLGASWGLLGVSWRPLGSSWGPLGQSWGPLGPSWGPLGPFSGPSGGLLGRLGAIFRASWAVLGPSWSVWGLSWGSLGPSWGDLVGPLGRLGPSEARCGENPKIIEKHKETASVWLPQALLGASWSYLGPSWGHPEASRAHRGQKSEKAKQTVISLGV